MANRKAVGRDEHPAELLKLIFDDNEDTSLKRFHDTIVNRLEWSRSTTKRKDATKPIQHQKKDRTERGCHRGIPLVAHASKVSLKIIASHLSAYCETERKLPEEQCGFRLRRPTIDMMSVVHRLQKSGQRQGIPLYMCFIDLPKGYYSVDRTFCGPSFSVSVSRLAYSP